ncbi:MAG: hypothetical protein RR540_00625 [Oscillospiraceae bacterium]
MKFNKKVISLMAAMTLIASVGAMSVTATAVPNPDSTATSIITKADGSTVKTVDPAQVIIGLVNADKTIEMYTSTAANGKATSFSAKANKDTDGVIADQIRADVDALASISSKGTAASDAAVAKMLKEEKNKNVKTQAISFGKDASFKYDVIVSVPVDTAIFKEGTTQTIYTYNAKTDKLVENTTAKITDGNAVFTMTKTDVFYIANIKMDLAAGEGVEVTTEAIATTAAVADTTAAPVATTPATNPTTGNAPIALALIPVAVIAAAVIAKKAK